MAQQLPDKPDYEQVLRLAEQLSPEEQARLRRQLDKSWNDRWDAVVGRIQARAQTMPPLSEEEIMSEVKAVREARKERGAQGGY